MLGPSSPTRFVIPHIYSGRQEPVNRGRWKRNVSKVSCPFCVPGSLGSKWEASERHEAAAAATPATSLRWRRFRTKQSDRALQREGRFPLAQLSCIYSLIFLWNRCRGWEGFDSSAARAGVIFFWRVTRIISKCARRDELLATQILHEVAAWGERRTDLPLLLCAAQHACTHVA